MALEIETENRFGYGRFCLFRIAPSPLARMAKLPYKLYEKPHQNITKFILFQLKNGIFTGVVVCMRYFKTVLVDIQLTPTLGYF